LKATEPKGFSEFLGESRKHKKWREEFELARDEVYRRWEACGGDMDAPDHGVAEANRRLTPEYARKEAERQVKAQIEIEEREARQKEQLLKDRQQAASRDTVTLKVGEKVICHTIETLLGKPTLFPAEIAAITPEAITVRTGGENMAVRREKCYFTEPPTPSQERDRRIAELDRKLNNPPNWIGSAGYPRGEAAADVSELVKLESMRLYDESDGKISEQDALEKAVERHPVIIDIQQRLERGRGLGR
jgi:hypothetical protein